MSSAGHGRRKAKKHEEEEHENHERWLVSYADMMTLLMVLFIVLFAISVVDKKKFAALADGLSHNFGATNKVLPAGTGVLDGGKTSNDDQGQLANNPAQPLSPIDQVEVSQLKAQQQQQQKENLIKQEQQTLLGAKEQIEAALKAKGLQNSASFKLTSRGLVVSIVTDQVLFDTGQANLKPVGQEVLDAVAPALAICMSAPRSNIPPAVREAQAKASNPEASSFVAANAGSGKTHEIGRASCRERV